VVSLYYYLGVVRQMYFRAPTDESLVTSGGMLKIALIISVIGVLLLGIYPNIVLDLANQAARVFLY
ncbi:MAG: NADH-quinone oxidoreductase subunit N, partial [Candidatus Zixiibacteriota bacterium]